MRVSYHDAPPAQIETGGLVLWHASWFAASFLCQTVAVTLVPVFTASPLVRPLAVGWSALGLPFILFQAYLIVGTCNANKRSRQAIFSDSVFVLLFILLACGTALTLWTLVTLAHIPT